MQNLTSVETYKPIPNFYDLREFRLTKKEFASCYRIQQFLSLVERKKEYYKQYHPHQWEAAKHIAVELQQFLLERELK